MLDDRCSQEGCEGGAERRGWCIKHYRRWQRYGDPGFAKMPRVTSPADALGRLQHVVDSATGCWLARRGVDKKHTGYASVWFQGRNHLAHRLSYQVNVGPIPEGLQLDHLCRRRECFNPEHLEPVTARENILRSPIAVATLNAAKTHCPQGHEYTPENVYDVPASSPGRGRQCKACGRACAKRKYAQVTASTRSGHQAPLVEVAS